jgi:hypothetical protein
MLARTPLRMACLIAGYLLSTQRGKRDGLQTLARLRCRGAPRQIQRRYVELNRGIGPRAAFACGSVVVGPVTVA